MELNGILFNDFKLISFLSDGSRMAEGTHQKAAIALLEVWADPERRAEGMEPAWGSARCMKAALTPPNGC